MDLGNAAGWTHPAVHSDRSRAAGTPNEEKTERRGILEDAAARVAPPPNWRDASPGGEEHAQRRRSPLHMHGSLVGTA